MISVLPTEIKQQLSYSKKNVVLRKYLILVVVIVAALLATIGGALWYANRQISNLQATLLEQQSQRASYKDTEANIQALQANLGLIEKIFNQKTEFSQVLGDIASVLPAGTYINSVELTGDDKKPVQLLITASSLTEAGLVRNALLQSDRISTADIQSITQNEGSSSYTVDIIIAFKEGQAR